MMCRKWYWIALLMVVVCFGCYGGGSQYAYYTLPSVQSPSIQNESQKAGRWIIGLGPVAIPEYLDRAAIVTRVSDTRLAVNDGHRWAGSLHTDILRVLAANLERHHHVKEVVIFPWAPRIEPDFRFKVEIKAFEGGLGGNVTLEAVWTLMPAKAGQAALRQVSLIQEKSDGRGMEGLVAAMGNAMSDLSREMAAAVEKTAP